MKQSTRQQGFAHIAIILAIVAVLAAVGFGGWYVWEKNKKEEPKQSASSQMESQQKEKGQKAKTPEGYILYENPKYDFSFAYPEKMGTLTAAAPANQSILFYANSKDEKDAFAPHTQSPLSVEARKTEAYVAGAGKYGPMLERKDGKWVVSDKENGDTLNGGYTIGSEYKVKVARTIDGVLVYDFSSGDEGCYHTAWVFQLSKAFVRISLPSVCADEIDTIPQERLNSYKEVTDKVLDTLTISQ